MFEFITSVSGFAMNASVIFFRDTKAKISFPKTKYNSNWLMTMRKKYHSTSSFTVYRYGKKLVSPYLKKRNIYSSETYSRRIF